MKNRVTNLDKNQPLFVGIDVHKTTWAVCIYHQGVILWHGTIRGEIAELLKLFQPYTGMVINSVYEAGFIGFYLHYCLEKEGVKNIIVSPNKLPKEAANLVKTDKIDCKKLAFYLMKEMIKPIYVPPVEDVNDRQLIRTREQIKRDKAAVINQIKSLIVQRGIYLDGPGISKKDRKFLMESDLPKGLKISLECQLTILEALEKQIKRLEEELEKMMTQEKYKKSYDRLIKMPGVGPITTTALILEIGDWKRFSNKKTLAAYIGLTPSEHSSGEHVRRGHITGQGKRFLRGLLVEVTWKMIANSPVVSKKFNDLWPKLGSKKKAAVAITRRMTGWMHSMMVRDQDFDEQKLAA